MVLDKQQTTGAVLIDLSKAFDTISHSLLLDTLNNYGLLESAIKLLSNYPSNPFQRVKIDANVRKYIESLGFTTLFSLILSTSNRIPTRGQ